MRSSFASILAALSAVAVAIPTISTKGSKFFDSDGQQFFVKGVAYQLSDSDPLLDTAQCTRDAELMKSLGANAIRVYHVTNGNHDGCMNAFSSNGIYLFVDLDTFSTYISQDKPYWNNTQKSAYEAVMDEFHTYDNVAGFFIGNEVVTQSNTSEAAVYVKAAVRDLKSYRDSRGYRKIPIGYSHADVSGLRPNLQNYLACGTNPNATIDFFGLNTYEWCGSSSFSHSGYDQLTDEIKDYPVPIFMSETGCNTVLTRTFQDQVSIFGPDMDSYWSGAIIYEWIQETNAYGLITYGGPTTAVSAGQGPTSPVRSGTPTPISPDFDNLKNVWATVSPSSIAMTAYNPSLTNPPCPTYTPANATYGWAVNGDVSLPQAGQTANAAATSSIIAGLGGSAANPTATGGSSNTHQGAAAPGVAAPIGNKVTGMGLGLIGVMLAFVWWL